MVKGKFAFKPEDRWRNVSPSAKDLISKLLVVDATKRLTVQQVREHPWCAEAVNKCAANLPTIKPKTKPTDQGKSSGTTVGHFNLPSSLPSSIFRRGSSGPGGVSVRPNRAVHHERLRGRGGRTHEGGAEAGGRV